MNLAYPREWLSIVNRALNLIGETALQDFTGTSESTQNALIQLPEVVQTVLSQHEFRCARKRTSLAPTVNTPSFGFTYEYQLPSDFCRLVSVSDNTEFTVEGDKILTDADTLNIVYVALPDTPTSLVPAVQECIVLLLAHNLARTTTTNDNLAVILYQQYQAQVQNAIKQDDSGEYQKPYEDWWTENR